VSSTKTWVVKENWMEVIRLLASELWPGQVTVVSKQQVEDAERSAREQQRIAVLAVLPERERAMFEFFEVCPLECLSAAYKRAATLLHPDKQNGDGDTMARLNAAWSKLEKELGTGK
jgi:L-lactate utilization protein LutC